MKIYRPTNKEKENSILRILKHFNWSGTKMIFPTKRGFAVIKLQDLIKCIKFYE